MLLFKPFIRSGPACDNLAHELFIIMFSIGSYPTVFLGISLNWSREWQAYLKLSDAMWICPKGRHFFTSFIRKPLVIVSKRFAGRRVKLPFYSARLFE